MLYAYLFGIFFGKNKHVLVMTYNFRHIYLVL